MCLLLCRDTVRKAVAQVESRGPVAGAWRSGGWRRCGLPGIHIWPQRLDGGGGGWARAGARAQLVLCLHPVVMAVMWGTQTKPPSCCLSCSPAADHFYCASLRHHKPVLDSKAVSAGQAATCRRLFTDWRRGTRARSSHVCRDVPWHVLRSLQGLLGDCMRIGWVESTHSAL